MRARISTYDRSARTVLKRDIHVEERGCHHILRARRPAGEPQMLTMDPKASTCTTSMVKDIHSTDKYIKNDTTIHQGSVMSWSPCEFYVFVALCLCDLRWLYT